MSAEALIARLEQIESALARGELLGAASASEPLLATLRALELDGQVISAEQRASAASALERCRGALASSALQLGEKMGQLAVARRAAGAYQHSQRAR